MWTAPKRFLEAFSLPDGWSACEMVVLGHPGTHVQMTGAVYPETRTRGRRKGEPNYDKPAPGTERSLIVTREEYRTLFCDEAA